jgi:ATP-binding cassette subfamily B protein
VIAAEGALLLGLALLRWALAGSRRAIGGWVGADVEYNLRNRLGRHLLAMAPSWHDRVQTGQLLSRAASDIRAIRFFLAFGQAFSILNLVTFVTVSASMWRLSPRLTLVALVLAAPLSAGTIRYGRRLHRVYWQLQQKNGDLTTVVEENAAGVRMVKAFGREAHEQARLAAQADAIRRENLRAARLQAFYGPLLGALPQLALAAVLWYGGRLTINGTITLGTLVAFNSYLFLLAQPLQSFGMLFGMAQRAAAGAERVFDVLDQPVAIADRPGATPLLLPARRGPRGARISFENVSFRYDSADGPVLSGVRLEIAPGERLALVGAMGAGKSTLAALIPRLYEPTGGRILLDGQDIAGVTLDSLRSAVGIVPQEPALLSATLRDNVALGPEPASDEEVRAALAVASAADLEAILPDGLDTVIGEQGHTLSGGQRQRVALARALLPRPRLLILDDALSHVDVATEAGILARLEDALGDTTVLLIASRPASLLLADRVVLLERGRVAAEGTHRELLRREPRYRAVLARAGADVDSLAREMVGGFAR